MNAPFDIFRAETNGGVLWIGSAATLADGKARVQELAARLPGDYVLVNQETGNRLVIRPDDVNRAPASWLEVDQGRRNTMSDEELKYPQWQLPLQELILEFDREKLPEQLQKVETLIFERLRQLRQGSDGRVETLAIDDALSLIRMIKHDRLGLSESKLAAPRL
jgi:hypothetical protein